MSIADRLTELGITIPEAPKPVAAYLPFVVAGDLVFVSGQLPMRNGEMTATGKVGRDLSIEQAGDAARTAVINALAQVQAAANGLDNVARIVRIGVFVNSDDGFTDQAKVANGASTVLADIFGEAGKHARAAFGVNELPLNAAVEVEMIAQIRR